MTSSAPVASALSATQQIIARHDQYQTINYGRYPIVMVRGQGSIIHDAEGKRYVDLFAGFGAGLLGHCHPELIDAVTQQAHKLWFAGNLMHSEPQTLLAEAIAKAGFGGKSFFCHSGADANEAAFKLARLYGRAKPGPKGKRYKVISTIHSFHGRTFATMMATGQDKVRAGYEPWITGFVNVPYNDLKAIENAIDDETVALIVESIQGEGGVNVPSPDYLPGLRRLCDQRDLLLIADEVWTGGGRTGKYFAHQHWNITPDMMTLAKGVGGGLAVGIMCAHPRIADLFDHRKHGYVAHATTLGGNLLSMAVATRIFKVLERDNLVEHSRQLGQYAQDRLRKFAAGKPWIKDVRGKGLFIGVELDPAQSNNRFANANDIVKKALERGLLINGTQNTVLRLVPAVNITRAELDEGLSLLESVLTS